MAKLSHFLHNFFDLLPLQPRKIKKKNKKCLLESIRPNPVINLVLFLRKENYLFFLDHFSKLPERRLRDFCSFFVSVCNNIIVQKFSGLFSVWHLTEL